jgi:hypothetical protein
MLIQQSISYSIQLTLYIALAKHFNISTKKTKVMALQDKFTVRNEITINGNISRQQGG